MPFPIVAGKAKTVCSTARRDRHQITDVCSATERSSPEESSSPDINNLPDADSY